MNKDFMKNLPEYTGGTLAEDEFLLKVRGDTGFMTKLNQDGSIPVAFKKWTDDPAVIFKEIPREGWKIVSVRAGKSQTWGRVVHPEGFILEIYAYSTYTRNRKDVGYTMMDLINNFTVMKGEIIGKLSWKDNLLYE